MTTAAAVAAVDLSKGAIRERASAFVARWRGEHREAAEKQTFWNELFAVFGVARRQVATFEALATRASTGGKGHMDLLYPGQMAVEHKSAGQDLEKALGQLYDYLPSLHQSEYPWLLIVCDFERFTWRNLDNGTHGKFTLEQLSSNLEVFWWIAGHGASPFAFEDEEEANLVATDYMAKLYDQLAASGYDEHALREWLTRVLFCLFADDTDVWDRAAFHAYVARFTHEDGHDLGPMLAHLFEVLDTPPEKRAHTLDEDLACFTYINGDLFANRLPIPSCNEDIRTALLAACRFDWGVITPAIFGSMFQNVMQPAERRQLGAHYTTEENILRTIRPLFINDLEAELAAANSKPRVEAFLDKLPTLRFMDPACGCGNFLVIAYREIRRLETAALRRLSRGRRAMSLDMLCAVNVSQFFGIELEEFPARIARTALYLADHMANRAISSEFGQHYVRFPIPSSPHIMIANALRVDWEDLLPANEAHFVFGNPPYTGMYRMTPEQQDDNRFVFSGHADRTLRAGRLDYVACWFAKSIAYAGNRGIRFAFVATNSLAQGEQARSLGVLLNRSGFAIDFAYRTFAWTSEAQGAAHVHVIIVGFSRGGQATTKMLFDFASPKDAPIPKRARNINSYLVDAPEVVIAKRSSGFVSLPKMTKGSQPTDDGGLIVEPEDYEDVRADPGAAQYVRRLLGARDMLNGTERWCLWLVEADPTDLRTSRVLRERLEHVAHFRRYKSKTVSVQALASTPALFTQIRQPRSQYLAVPRHSSEIRRVVPMAYFGPEVIAHDSILTIEDAPLWLLGVLQSAMYMAWCRTVAGRLESRLRIEADLTYNTFPLAESVLTRSDRIAEAMHGVLSARTRFPEASLADLYHPLSMPSAVVKAHDELDRAVDGAFALRRRFVTEGDRLTLLFERYQALTTEGTLPGTAEAATRRRRAR